MRILVTGGAGFIGRWITKCLLEKKEYVWILDDLSNGQKSNLEEFKGNPYLRGFIIGDIRNREIVSKVFRNEFDICIHLAAQINVQESLDDPEKAFDVNVLGTFNLLEAARKYNTKIVLVGTCMVYDMAKASKAISEGHPVKPTSPYAASKLAAENIALSYYYSYGLPVTILRPFNTYGPYQKSNMEGGVVAIFIQRNLENKALEIFGDGTQTRDLLYVEDCADFIVKATFSDELNGEILNAGFGSDVSIDDLAVMICKDQKRMTHVEHHHPQSEIQKLVCDYSKAKKLLNWKPKTSLEEGIKKTENWINSQIKGESQCCT